MASVEVSNITSTGFKVRVTGLQATYAYQRQLRWWVRNVTDDVDVLDEPIYKTIAAYSGSGGDYTFTGMKPSTEYNVSCAIYGLVNGREDYLTTISSGSFYTDDSSGGDDGGDENTWHVSDVISLGMFLEYEHYELVSGYHPYSVQPYSINFVCEGTVEFYTTGSADTGGEYSENLSFDIYEGSSDYIKADDNSGDGNNFYIKSNTVYPNKTYYLWVKCWDNPNDSVSTLHIVFTPSSTTGTVAKWSWTASNGTASATDTSAAYNAVKNKQSTKNFSHLVWNDMVDKVYKVIKAYSSSAGWDSSYASYENTKMNSSPYYLTAVKFNSLRNNIEIVGGWLKLGYRTDIGKVESGDYVYGEYFLTLADYINACIDKL